MTSSKRPPRATSAIPTGARSNTEAEALVELDPRVLPGAGVGEVLADPDQVARPAAGAVDRAADAKVAQLAVTPADRDEAVEAAVLRHRAIDLVPEAVTVALHDAVEDTRARGDVVLRLDAEDAIRLRRPGHRLGLEVAVEGADLGEPLRFGEALLRAPALGDLFADAVEAPHGPVGAHVAPARQSSSR